MIKIITDSTADVPQSMALENDIAIVPLKVSYHDHDYLDGVTLTRNDFYEALTSETIFPKTSQPTPNDFLTPFEKIKEAGDECICITLSSSLSGTYQSALLAKKLVDYEKIYIVDSLSATAGMLLLINQACKRVKEGREALQIVDELEKLKNRIHVVAALSTLEYLKRGGRISSAAAAIGSLARIKPIITVDVKGNVDVFAKAVGYQKAVNQVLEELKGVDTAYPVYPVYTYGTENLNKLLANVKDSNLPIAESIQVGPTIGTHIGPEVFGFVFIGPERPEN